MQGAPLQGIRVISFGVGIVIPDLGKTLGQLGADVIKIESVGQPDFMRTIVPDLNNSPGFNEANRNHRCFGVDLNREEGKELVRGLIRTADVVAENYRADVMDKLGFDYERVREIRPDILYLSSQGFGKGGPYSGHKAYGPTLIAASGVLSLWAQPDEAFGCGGTFPHPDNMASWHCALAVLAALDYRQRTGVGQFIDVSQVEVATGLIGEAHLDYTINKRVQKPIGNRSPHAAPHGCYRCKGEDRWCAVSVWDDREWERFLEAMGNPEWAKDPKFSDTVGRLRNVEELDGHVEAWTLLHDPHEIMETLQAAGIAAGNVYRAVDEINDPQLKWQNAIVEIEHPVSGKRLYPASPFRMQQMEFPPDRPAPLLGQHTDEICREILNLSAEEIDRLKADNILSDATTGQGGKQP